jgi:hypothetical protein
MGAYYMNEAMFDLAEAGFVDRTVTYLEGTSPGGADVVLLVERQPFPEGKSLRQVTAQHVNDARKRLRGYSVIFQRDVEVAGLPAIDLGVRWREESGTPVYTRQTHLAVGGAWLIVAGEVPLAEREFCDAYVDRALGSLQLRE